MEILMKRKTLRALLTAAIPCLIVALPVPAWSNDRDDFARHHHGDPIEGVWDVTVTARDCATGAALGVFNAQAMFHRGGTLTDMSAAPPTSRGIGVGVWRRDGPGPTYTAIFRFNRFNADGTLFGSRVVTRRLTLSYDANMETSVNTSEDRDPSGTVVATGCTTDVGKRLF
jgi:hypothetical protein